MIKYLYIVFIIALGLFLVQKTSKYTELETKGITTIGTVIEECGNKGSIGVRYRFRVSGRYFVGCDPEVQIKIGNEVTVWYHSENPAINQIHPPEKDGRYWYVVRIIVMYMLILLLSLLIKINFWDKLKAFISVNLGEQTSFKTTNVDQKWNIIHYDFWVNGKYYTGSCRNKALMGKTTRRKAAVYYLSWFPKINTLR